MVDSGDYDLTVVEAVEDHLGSAADREFAEIRFRGGMAKMRVEAKGLDEPNDARGETFCGWGIVQNNESANFTKGGWPRVVSRGFRVAGALRLAE